MLLGVDLVGQLAVGLVHLVVVAALAQQLQDLVLGDLHGRALPAPALGYPSRAIR